METQLNINKICIIGYGYWGKIIHKNLISVGYSNIKIIDILLDNFSELDDSYTHYFVITPFTSHYKILEIISQYKNKKIWCEKPLTQSLVDANKIYSMVHKNNNKLFIDWIYTFNPCIDRIKNIISNKKIKQVILNRTNDGPMRSDCGSIHDLSSHDLSILYHIFPKSKFDFTWNEFSVKSNEDRGSSINWSYKNGLQIIINSSWQHKIKNRTSLFITEDDEVIVFDDVKKTVVTSDGVEDFSKNIPPLIMAIYNFFSNDDFKKNMDLTLKITKNLENAI